VAGRDEEVAPRFFATAARFRAWLAKNAAKATHLVVGFHTVGSGKPCMTWPQSVDEALAVGWIDGLRKRIDGTSYQIRFGPRRAGSIWSDINIRKAEALIEQGRMTPAGMQAFERRIEQRSRIYSYERPLEMPAELLAQFQRNRRAWRFFESCPPSYRRQLAHWVAAAKRPETRERRLAKLVESCAAGHRLLR
jgi:uncharacterized protein YdeI (YjbR/CyaY-like superfamily)